MIAQSMLSLLAPEFIVGLGSLAVLLCGLRQGRSPTSDRKLAGILTLVVLLAAAAAAWWIVLPGNVVQRWGLKVGNLAGYVRLVTLGISLLVVLVHWCMSARNEHGELFSLILLSVTGLLLTALADDLVVLFLAVELVSIPTYIMAAMSRTDVRAQEASVKYFFLGALSSAVMVYGFSFIYGTAGSTVLGHSPALGQAGGYLQIGLLLAFAGVAFKMAAVPMHAYVADVYQGSAAPLGGLLAFFPKMAGILVIIKLLPAMGYDVGAAGSASLNHVGFIFLWVVAAATMTVGNVLGLMQSNVKRILAYSSIAHSGYMLIGLLVVPGGGGAMIRDGWAATLFYMVAYAIMNLGAFAVLAVIRRDGRPVEELKELGGLSKRQPALALVMAICVFSLMGMPPTAGFMGKLYVFGSALSVGAQHPYEQAMIVLAIIGVVNSAIAAGYYLRIIGACYLAEDTMGAFTVLRSGAVRLGLLLCCLLVVLIGLWPGPLMRMARQPSYDLLPVTRHIADAGNLPPQSSSSHDHNP